MNIMFKTLIEKEYLSKEDIRKNKNYMSITFSKIMENLGKSFVIFFAFLFLMFFIVLSARFSMPTIAILSFIWLVKDSKSYFPPILLTSSLLITIGLYADGSNFYLDESWYFIVAFALHNIYCFVFKNIHMQKLYPIVFYTFLLIFPIKDLIFYEEYLLLISIVNFIFIILLILKERVLRRKTQNYLAYLVEGLLLGLGISVWYEWLNMSDIFFDKSNRSIFMQGNTAIYLIGSVLILFLLKKEKLIKTNTFIINIVLALISFQIPFISFALFLFNCSLYREWFWLSRVSLGLIVLCLFLLYHSFSASFAVKSISTFAMGLIMLVTYIYIKRKGDKNE